MADSQPPIAVSNLHVVRALIAKDWRFFRAPAVALISLGIGCYLIGLEGVIHARKQHQAYDALFNASIGACELSALLAAMFGGIAIAGERADRTLDFLALLPVTRRQIVLSKWVISLAMLGIAGVFHLLMAYLFNKSLEPLLGRSQVGEAICLWVVLLPSFFGIAWLLSTFLRSGTISACASIAATIAWLAVAGILLDANHRDENTVRSLIVALSLVIGLTSLVGGTLHYVRRVEP